MALTLEQVIGRIGLYIASAENLHVRKHNIRKILSINHSNLHAVIPNMLREYLTTAEPLTVTAGTGSPRFGSLDLSDLPTVVAGGDIKELQSVTFAGSASKSASAYKKAISLEHFRGQDEFDEETGEGRFWWATRGMGTLGQGKIQVYQGEYITGETTLEVGFVREMDTKYVSVADYNSKKNSPMDCPSEAMEFLIMNTARDCILEKKHKVPEYIGQDLQEQRTFLTQLDSAIYGQIQQNEQRGVDIR